jgi:hypothetical protein
MRGAQWPRAVEFADRALALGEPNDLLDVVADAFNNKAASLRSLGRGREAMALMQAAIDIAAAGGFVGAELRARNNLGSVTFDQDVARARAVAREALTLAERVGHRGMEHWAGGLVAAASYGMGDGWDEALALADQALASPLSLSDEARNLSISWFFRAARGEDGRSTVTRLDEIADATKESGEIAAATAARAVLAFSDGDFATSRDLFIRAADRFQSLANVYLAEASHAAAWARDLATLRTIGQRLDAFEQAYLPSYRVERVRTWAGVAALEGGAAEATARSREALAGYEDLGARFDRARAVSDAVWLLGTADPGIAAAAEEAEALFEKLGAKPYLAKLREAIRRPREAAQTTQAVPVT